MGAVENVGFARLNKGVSMTKEEIDNIATEAATSALSGRVMEQVKDESVPIDEDKLEEECHCDNLKPMEEWLGEEDVEGEQCHECILRPIAEYYLGALQEENAEVQAKKLEEAWEGADLLTIGAAMDKIKGEVGESLKKRLLNYDCYAQTYKKSEAAVDEQQQED